MYDEGYLRYSNIRNMAWSLLIQCNMTRLPVDMRQMADQLGVSVMTYAESEKLIAACDLDAVRAQNRAFSVYTDRWFILYDAEGKTPMFAIAHELAHILLKHPTKKQKCGLFTAHYTDFNCDMLTFIAEEQDADRLAVRLLSPACILRHLRVCDPKTLMELCGLPSREAVERVDRVAKLIQKGHFFSHKDEERVYEQFLPFMEGAPELFDLSCHQEG